MQSAMKPHWMKDLSASAHSHRRGDRVRVVDQIGLAIRLAEISLIKGNSFLVVGLRVSGLQECT